MQGQHQFLRVQTQPPNAQAFGPGELLGTGVLLITYHGMPRRGRMHPNLVSAAGVQPGRHERGRPVRLEHLEVRTAGLAFRGYPDPLLLASYERERGQTRKR